MRTALVDGDILVYKACFATEYSVYEVNDMQFRYKSDVSNFLSFNFDEEEFPTVEKSTVVEPIQNTYYLLDLMLNTIYANTQSHVGEIYVSGPSNFRKSIPYPVVYKGNRPPKPVNHPLAVKYLIERHNAIMADGLEADDMLGIRQHQLKDSVICSIDKDLLMIPGLHYHLDKQEFTEVTEDEATRHFYLQMLTGDRIDNIIGISGVGPAKAEKLLAGCKDAADMDRVVVAQYKKQFKENWSQMYEANASLLWIMREPIENTISESKGQESAEVGGLENSFNS